MVTPFPQPKAAAAASAAPKSAQQGRSISSPGWDCPRVACLLFNTMKSASPIYDCRDVDGVSFGLQRQRDLIRAK